MIDKKFRDVLIKDLDFCYMNFKQLNLSEKDCEKLLDLLVSYDTEIERLQDIITNNTTLRF